MLAITILLIALGAVLVLLLKISRENKRLEDEAWVDRHVHRQEPQPLADSWDWPKR